MNQQYTCLIIDDDLIERDATAMFLSKINNLVIVAECADAFEALEILQAQQIDIIFCDINMPHLSGIGLKKSLQHPPVFVFITSYSSHAAESYEVDALDFVTKPASFERLLKAFNKAIEYIGFIEKRRANGGLKEEELALLPRDTAQEYFFIKGNDGFTKLYTADILYIESMGDFSKIIMTNNSQHVILAGLKSLEKQLPETKFIRVHKQYIIGLWHIETIGATEVTLTGKLILPLSIGYKQQLLAKAVNSNILSR